MRYPSGLVKDCVPKCTLIVADPCTPLWLIMQNHGRGQEELHVPMKGGAYVMLQDNTMPSIQRSAKGSPQLNVHS